MEQLRLVNSSSYLSPWMGSLVLPFGWSKRTIYAGRYYDKPAGMFGVKMAAEIDEPCDIDIPVEDFSVPENYEGITEGAKTVLEALAFNRKVYVGCKGGLGRTGLFLATLAKSLGVKDPIQYVRDHYNEHAVETQGQTIFLDEMPMEELYRAGRIAVLEAGMADFLGWFGVHIND